MSLVVTLVRASPVLFTGALVAALVSGLGSAALVMLINQALHAAPERLAWSVVPFAAVAALVMATQAGSQALFSYLGQDCLGRLRRTIAEAALRAPHRQLEIVGRARIRSCLSDDAANIANFGVGLPILVTNVVVIVGALAYLAWLSPGIFVLAGGMMGLGTAGYYLAHRKVAGFLRRAGQSQDRLYEQFEGMLGGAKELKLNETKAARFLDIDMTRAIDAVGRDRARGLALLSLADGWGRFLFMALVGTVLFARLWLPSGSGIVVTGYVVAFLYLMGPLEGALSNVPYINLARIAIGRVQIVLDELAAEPTGGRLDRFGAPETISLEGVIHGYFREREEDVFTLGPVDLALHRGETTFIVGGNGSGKTTLAKLITGLYAPEGGAIRVDGKAVDEAGRAAYRQLFSAVFADFHLFETLLEGAGTRLDAHANAWLAELHLDHKVSVRDGAFTTRDLSQGQRKRLALVAACVEDRPVLVFDEWAADQDPAFKEVFYREILAELKASGKTLMVVTHDDRYFDVADRIVKLEGGRIVETPQPEPIRVAQPALRLAGGNGGAAA